MPALSKKQQKFMGIVRSIQKGEADPKNFTPRAQAVAKDMKKTDVKKFASTKHKGLPMKKEVLKKLKEMIRQELSEYTYGVGDVVKDANPTCPHYGAQGKVKSVNPKSVVFVVTNKGKNFKPGMELEKSHDQMKKMNEAKFRDVSNKFKNALDDLPQKKFTTKNIQALIKKMREKRPDSAMAYAKDAYGWLMKESVNEMSAKSKKIISKLGKKEKEMFMDMVDMMGFDQVMADYKRDKKAFKQALKDMSESVIKEYVEPNQFNKNFDTAINLVIKQANNLKGALAKHPIKRNVNKLKAVLKLYNKFIAPALVIKDRRLSKDFDFTDIKKKLSAGKFKSALEYSIMNRIGGGSYDANSFFMLDDKTKKLKDRIYGELKKIVDVMDKAQLESFEEGFGSDDTLNEKDKNKFEKERVENAEVLGYELTGIKDVKENINEDGHTDVASSKRKVMIMVDDSNKLLNKLNGMNKEDSLPSWWTDKITLSQNYLAKATDYIINPVESVNEAKYKVHMRDKKRGNFELEKFQTGGQSYDYKKGMDIVKKLRKMSGSLEYKLVKENMELKKLEDAILMFQKKIKKQGRVTNARDEDHLKNLIKVYKQMGGRKIKESVNEGGVEKVLKMANDQSFGKLGGRTVDALSAGLFKGVYDKASDKNKEKINKMNEKQLYVFMTKLWSKFGNQVRIG